MTELTVFFILLVVMVLYFSPIAWTFLRLEGKMGPKDGAGAVALGSVLYILFWSMATELVDRVGKLLGVGS